MKKAIITGCFGQDGRLLYELLESRGYHILGIGCNNTQSNVSFPERRIDIQEFSDVSLAINEFQPDEVYHLAAFHHSSEDCVDDELLLFQKSYKINVLTLMNILEAARRSERSVKIFYAASSLIFGNSQDEIQDESTPVTPICIYGITKAAGLHLCRYYRRKYSLFASCGILYNHESVLRQEKFISRKIIKSVLAIKNKKMKELSVGNLSAKVDWGYAPDFVDAFYRILQLSQPDDYIVATGQKHSVQEFIQKAFDAVSLDWHDYVKEKTGVLERKRNTLVGNPQKLMNHTGWRPSVSFEEMIHLLVQKEATERYA